MTIEAVGIITSNVVLVLGAVWRMSALLSKIETQLKHVDDRLNLHAESVKSRMDSFEVRLLNLERKGG